MFIKLGLPCFIFCCSIPMAEANYPGMDDSKICNGFDTIVGHVTKVVATTTYDGNEAVFINLVRKDNKQDAGGRIYPRDPVAYGYTPMVNIANIALVTNSLVKLCVSSTGGYGSGNDVYAIELMGSD